MTNKESVYGAIVDYFGDLKLKLIKDTDGWYIYCAKIASGLNEQRYIYAISYYTPYLQSEMNLNDLDWVNFQTRTSDEILDVPSYNFSLNETKKKMLSDKIKVLNRTENESIYITDNLPIKIKLLHSKKNNNQLQYPDQALLYQALNTFQCIIETL